MSACSLSCECMGKIFLYICFVFLFGIALGVMMVKLHERNKKKSSKKNE